MAESTWWFSGSYSGSLLCCSRLPNSIPNVTLLLCAFWPTLAYKLPFWRSVVRIYSPELSFLLCHQWRSTLVGESSKWWISRWRRAGRKDERAGEDEPGDEDGSAVTGVVGCSATYSTSLFFMEKSSIKYWDNLSSDPYYMVELGYPIRVMAEILGKILPY